METVGEQTVGVRELKTHLSAALKRVRDGARLVVTDRGRPIAVIAPADDMPVPSWVLALVREGAASWMGGKPHGMLRRIPGRGKATSAMVIEDRK